MHSDATPDERSEAWAARGAAFLSGITALTAQMVWIRALGRAMGTTTESLAAVAGVFLAGLGLGAWLGGRRAASSRSPGRAAALALLAAAALVLASPWLFHVLPDLHLALLNLLGAEPGPNPWPALLLALPLLLVPTTLMGLSFPLLVAASRRSGSSDPRGVGGLYALNTAGAALGVLLTVLALPAVGERLTLCGAALLEALAALCVWRLRGGRLARVSEGVSADTPTRAARTPGTPAATRALLALTGLCGLTAEVAAFRLLEPFGGPHLWGVVLLLMPVLLGIAFGAALGGRAAARAGASRRSLTTLLTLAGLFTLAMIPVAGALPRLLLEQGGPHGLARVFTIALGTALALVPPMAALGACFPLGVRAATEGGTSAARASGDLGAWNALGSLLGSLLAGFVLLPTLGAIPTLLLVASVLLAAAPLWHLAQARERRLGVVLAAALPLALLALPGVRRALEASGPRLPEVVAVIARRPPVVRDAQGAVSALALQGGADARLYGEWFGGRPAHAPGRPDAPPVPARDGRMGTVALLEEPGGSVRLRVNGLSEAQLDPEAPDRGSATEVALGLLPVLTHPAPKRALVIGHGAGWTAEAVLATDVEQVDVAELDATVLEMVELFRGHPLAVRSDPKARLWLTDGRLLLRRAANGDAPRYDVIASQPSHPWVPGAGHLFTLEAYRLARAALAEDGVFAQWLNLFEMSPPLMESALATFRAAFPRCWVFLFDQEAVLLGFASTPRLDAARWQQLLTERASVRTLASRVGLTQPGDLWRRFTLDEDGVERVAPTRDTPLVVDDRPSLELGLAWRVLTDADSHELLSGRSIDLGERLRAGFPPDFARALPDEEARATLAGQAIHSLVLAGERPWADRWDGSVRWGSTGEARRTRAALARARDDHAGAERLLRESMEEAPANGEWAADWIGMLVARVRELPHLAQRLLADAAPVVARHPEHGRVLSTHALLLAACGEIAAAREAYEAALRAERPPAPPTTAVDYARLLLVSEPRGGRGPALGPDAGAEMHALSLLRSAAPEAMGLDALELRARLEARLGDDAMRAEAETRVGAQRRTDARQARRAAWAWLGTLDGSALGAAQEAVALEPDNVEGWELCALAWLQLARGAAPQGERLPREDEARAALGQALRVARDRAWMERRARAYLRWFGASADGLAPARDE